jgi:hypothetical protein
VREAYIKVLKQAHGKTNHKIAKGLGIFPDEKQPPLPGPITPQGREKEHK